ncbi:MAG: YigZ family protein [Erysipelothrix sp.]|nr:YigZ family protein [Erysipelothrix sp.]
MYRIQEEVIDTFVERKSEFITYLQRVEDEDAARAYIDSIKKLHPKATHHCQAFIIDNMIQRSNDDGEPSGTAGIPMLEILRKREMELIVAVVVRYFGGILLGAGGLIRAYSRGVSDALNVANIYQVKLMQKSTITVDYQYADQIEKLLEDYDVLEKDYEMQVSFTYLHDNDDLKDTFNEITRGTIKTVTYDPIEIEVKVRND